jgi:hypothetical protein
MFRSDAVSTVAMLAVLAFSVDRIVTGLMFLLSFNKSWSRRFPEPSLLNAGVDRFNAERKQKLTYFIMAAVLTVAVLSFADQVRVLAAL